MRSLLCVLAAGPALGPAASEAAPTELLGHSGRWITDQDGRVVMVRGVQQWGPNGALPGPLPFGHKVPGALGYGREDAQFLASHGFNAVRLSMSYWEYEPGRYDDAYLDGFADYVRVLREEGIYSLLDMQQAIYGPRFSGGEGFPDWMTFTDGIPPVDAGYPASYQLNSAMNRAWDNLWDNRPASDGVGLQDHFAAGWRHLAGRFEKEDGVLGYDFINEPWPGSVWPSCAQPSGCPPGVFDETKLAPLYARVRKAVREADNRHLLVHEPNLLFDFGSDTLLGPLGDPKTVFGFHNYCLNSAAPGAPDAQPCEVGENLVFDNAERHSQRTGEALLMGEWGGTSSVEGVARMTDNADARLMPWMYWWYGRLVPDATKAPTGANIDLNFLRPLVRPYLPLVAGTPTSMAFDRQTKGFRARYTTTLPDGRAAGNRQSEAFIPRLHYGGDYRLSVRGAEVTRGLGTQRVNLRGCPGETAVTVEVADAPPVDPLSCQAQALLARAGGRAVGPGTECLAARLRVSSRGVGPARLAASLRTLANRYLVVRAGRRFEVCVRGSGRVVARTRKGRIVSVATTVPGHFSRRAAPGRRARIGGTRRIGRNLLLGRRERRPGRVVYALRAGRVRYIAVVRRATAARTASLRRELRLLSPR